MRRRLNRTDRVAGLIGHTQPRRIAARATVARIAQELKTELGGAVGYKIRFNIKSSPAHLYNAASANSQHNHLCVE